MKHTETHPEHITLRFECIAGPAGHRVMQMRVDPLAVASGPVPWWRQFIKRVEREMFSEEAAWLDVLRPGNPLLFDPYSRFKSVIDRLPPADAAGRPTPTTTPHRKEHDMLITVGQLIEKLADYDPDIPVQIAQLGEDARTSRPSTRASNIRMLFADQATDLQVPTLFLVPRFDGLAEPVDRCMLPEGNPWREEA